MPFSLSNLLWRFESDARFALNFSARNFNRSLILLLMISTSPSSAFFVFVSAYFISWSTYQNYYVFCSSLAQRSPSLLFWLSLKNRLSLVKRAYFSTSAWIISLKSTYSVLSSYLRDLLRFLRSILFSILNLFYFLN